LNLDDLGHPPIITKNILAVDSGFRPSEERGQEPVRFA